MISESFAADTYLRALNEIRAHVECIHRTNCRNANIAKEMLLDKYKGGANSISWKYSNAPMYSQPLFERLWDDWKDVIPDQKTQLLYTVRNDDFYALRGGDPSFLSAYFLKMKCPYTAAITRTPTGIYGAGNSRTQPTSTWNGGTVLKRTDSSLPPWGGWGTTRLWRKSIG